MRKFIKILPLLIFLGIFSITSAAFALEVQWPSSPAGTQLTDESNITDLVKYLYEWGITLGGLAAFFALVIAGFQYLTSAGDPTKMKEAQGRITSAVLGLVLLLCSFLILNTINPELTRLKMPEVRYFGAECNECMKQWGEEWIEKCIEECGLMETPPGVTSNPCDKVIVYSEAGYKGEVKATISRGNYKNLSLIKDSGSIKFIYIENGEEKEGGRCKIELHKFSGCDTGDPQNIAPYYNSILDIRSLYLSFDIQCIKVEELYGN